MLSQRFRVSGEAGDIDNAGFSLFNRQCRPNSCSAVSAPAACQHARGHERGAFEPDATDSKYIAHSTKRILIILIIFIQYTTMVVVRNDTIIDNWHYTFTGITFGLVYIYHYTMHDNCTDDTHADNSELDKEGGGALAEVPR